MAWTATTKVNKGTEKWKQQLSMTSAKAIFDGTTPAFGGKALKMAYVEIVLAGSDAYANGGQVCDILSNLPGWTYILGSFPIPFYNSTSTAAWEYVEPFDANNATAGSRKVLVKTQLAGAEIGTRTIATSTWGTQVMPLIVFGY